MERMIVMSGPCVIESAKGLNAVAEALKPLAENPQIDFYFKASFDKANRTSLKSYRGPGLEKGLAILEEIKKNLQYKSSQIFTKVIKQKRQCEVADMLQIPAFLCRQTDLIVAAAKTPAIINIKKGQFLTPATYNIALKKCFKRVELRNKAMR